MKKLIIGLSVAVVLSSIFISKSFNDNYFIPCYFGNFFILSALLLFQIAVLFFSTKKTTQAFSFSILDIAVVSWFALSALSILISGNSFNNHHFINFSLLVLLYFVFQHNLKSGVIDILPVFSWILFIAGAFQLLYGSLQYFDIMQANTIFKVVGNFGNPGLLSLYVTILFLWFLALLLFEHTKKGLTIASVIFCSISLIFIVFLFNRASWVVVAVCVPMMLHFRYGIFPFFIKLSLPKKVVIISILILGIIIAIPFLYSLKKESSDGRLFIWQRTVEMIKDHPIAGVGYNAFETNYNSYQANYFKSNPNDALNAHVADNIGYAFNEFLQTTAELGVVGLLAFLCVIFFALGSIVKTKPSKTLTDDMFRAIAQIILIAFIIFSFVSYPLRTIPNSTLFFLFLSIAAVGTKPKVSFTMGITSWRSLLGISAILLFSFIIYQTNQLKSYKDWHKAMISIESGDSYGLTKMGELYQALEHDKLFLYNYGTELSIYKEYDKSIEVLERARPKLNNYNVFAYLGNNYEAINKLDKAIECFEMADNLIPSRIYTKYRLFRLYDMTNDKRAVPMAKNVYEMPAKGLSENVGILRQKAKEFLDRQKQ